MDLSCKLKVKLAETLPREPCHSFSDFSPPHQTSVASAETSPGSHCNSSDFLENWDWLKYYAGNNCCRHLCLHESGGAGAAEEDAWG